MIVNNLFSEKTQIKRKLIKDLKFKKNYQTEIKNLNLNKKQTNIFSLKTNINLTKTYVKKINFKENYKTKLDELNFSEIEESKIKSLNIFDFKTPNVYGECFKKQPKNSDIKILSPYQAQLTRNLIK